MGFLAENTMKNSEEIRSMLEAEVGPLFELRIVNKSDDNNIIINYKDLLIMLPEYGEDIPPDVEDALKRITADDEDLDFSTAVDIEDVIELAKEATDLEDVDIIVAEIDGDTLHVFSMHDDMSHGLESDKIHKIARALGIEHIEIDNSSLRTMTQRSVNFPSIAYHGTSLNALLKMLKSGGLKPMGYERSNYEIQGIRHENHVFMTTKPRSAFNHAINASRQDNSNPIIIKLKIPDKRLISPDYDVDTSRGSTHFQNVRARLSNKPYNASNKSYRALGHSRDIGRFGYSGRIPPSHFEMLYTTEEEYAEDIGDFSQATVKELISNIRSLEEIGIDPSEYEEHGITSPILFDDIMISEIVNEYRSADEDIE